MLPLCFVLMAAVWASVDAEHHTLSISRTLWPRTALMPISQLPAISCPGLSAPAALPTPCAQLAVVWMVLPHNHARRAILAQHFPQLLVRILHFSSGLTSADSSSAPHMRAAGAVSVSVAAGSTLSGAARAEGCSVFPSKSVGSLALQPSTRHSLTRALSEGLALRKVRHARSLMGPGHAGMRVRKAGASVQWQVRLNVRMRKVRLAMLAHRQAWKGRRAKMVPYEERGA